MDGQLKSRFEKILEHYAGIMREYAPTRGRGSAAQGRGDRAPAGSEGVVRVIESFGIGRFGPAAYTARGDSPGLGPVRTQLAILASGGAARGHG